MKAECKFLELCLIQRSAKVRIFEVFQLIRLITLTSDTDFGGTDTILSKVIIKIT